MHVVKNIGFNGENCNGRCAYDFKYELTEEDFYPPEDLRLCESLVEDIDGGDCYADYVEYFWSSYEGHIFDCNN